MLGAGSAGRLKSVAEAPYSHQIVSVGFNPLAQCFDVGVHCASGAHELIPPHLVEQRLAREGLVRVLREKCQQGILPWC